MWPQAPVGAARLRALFVGPVHDLRIDAPSKVSTARHREGLRLPVGLPGLPKACLQLLTGVTPDEQRDEGPDRCSFEPSDHLIQAVVDCLRIELVIELFVHKLRDSANS